MSSRAAAPDNTIDARCDAQIGQGQWYGMYMRFEKQNETYLPCKMSSSAAATGNTIDARWDALLIVYAV
jgi:hypothetical protein